MITDFKKAGIQSMIGLNTHVKKMLHFVFTVTSLVLVVSLANFGVYPVLAVPVIIVRILLFVCNSKATGYKITRCLLTYHVRKTPKSALAGKQNRK